MARLTPDGLEDCRPDRPDSRKNEAGDRLLSDLSLTDKPERQIVFKTPEDLAEGYSASREWLKTFSEFSRDSGGFAVF